ncbi:S9 family peptidase [Tenacibaculum sp. 190524A02b]|uniref:S9 family peptidase n=1 Tax=Tenacibaculum vairaonense TaxID=3137860 RepID=UPI0031FA5A33
MKKIVYLIVVILIHNLSMAQEKKDSIPGNPKLPSTKEELAAVAANEKKVYKYSVNDYFKKSTQSSFGLSPNGLYLSYRERDSNGKAHVYIKNTTTNTIKKVIEEGENLIADYGWINNKRLFYAKDKGGDENYQLYAVDIDGKNKKALTPFKDIQVSILSFLRDQEDYIIIQMNKDNPQIFEPYKLNIVNGNLEKLFTNTDPNNSVFGYVFDKDGELRAYKQRRNGTEHVLFYKVSGSDKFEEIVTTTWKEDFSIAAFNYQTPYPHDAYIGTNIYNDTKELILYDLKKKEIIKKIYTNKSFDVNEISFSRKRNYELDYYGYVGEKRVEIPISKTYKKRYKFLKERFKNKEFIIVSRTTNEDKLLVYVTSDKLTGIYYIYDTLKNTTKELLNLRPELDPRDMAEVKPIKFKSRDGLTIYGYLTIPNEAKKGKKIPLIVNPHGGPYGIRDSWGFNPETQLFASRGYATLQVNYRGSGGYGKEFYLAGSKQIGRKMLNDLEDAVAYVKTLNLIDENNIAIYGASYGGLATLGSLVKTPDLYKCGVDYVGVSNLFTFVDSFPAYWKPLMKQFYEQWYDSENPEEKEIMKAVSPALHVDKITKPLFVVQGANDPRVNINESDQIVSNLRNRGVDVPYMVKYNEGHGFGHEENTIELYKTMMGFFAKHLK